MWYCHVTWSAFQVIPFVGCKTAAFARYLMRYIIIHSISRSQLSLRLRLLEDRLHLRRLFNISIPSTQTQTPLSYTFITSPLTFNFPLMNSFCAFALPWTSFLKSASDNTSVTAAFFPSGAAPLPTVPVSLRSMYHDSCAPALFLRVKAKIALPCLMASLRSASEDERERAISSKAVEEGKSSESVGQHLFLASKGGMYVPFLRGILVSSCRTGKLQRFFV
jgi:hypothetical protein